MDPKMAQAKRIYRINHKADHQANYQTRLIESPLLPSKISTATISPELTPLRRLLLRTFTRIPMAVTAGPMPASPTSTQTADPTAATIVAMTATTIAGPIIGAIAAIRVTAVIGAIVVGIGATVAILEVTSVGTGDMIDLKWALIDNEWVIYQSELDEWVKTKGQPYCPVCRGVKGVKNSRKEGNIKRGECASCGARLTIMKG